MRKKLLIVIICICLTLTAVTSSVYAWYSISAQKINSGTQIADTSITINIYSYDKTNGNFKATPETVASYEIKKIGFNQMEIFKMVFNNTGDYSYKINLCFNTFAADTEINPLIYFYDVIVFDDLDESLDLLRRDVAVGLTKPLINLIKQENWLNDEDTITVPLGSSSIYFAFSPRSSNDMNDTYIAMHDAFIEEHYSYDSNNIVIEDECYEFIQDIEAIKNVGYDGADIVYSAPNDDAATLHDMDLLYSAAKAWNYAIYDKRWPSNELDESNVGITGILPVPEVLILAELQ